jgi:hypothetical protein
MLDSLGDFTARQKHERIGFETRERVGKIAERHHHRFLHLIGDPQNAMDNYAQRFGPFSQLLIARQEHAARGRFGERQAEAVIGRKTRE